MVPLPSLPPSPPPAPALAAPRLGNLWIPFAPQQNLLTMEQILSVEETQVKDRKCILLRIKGGKQFVLQCEVTGVGSVWGGFIPGWGVYSLGGALGLLPHQQIELLKK